MSTHEFFMKRCIQLAMNGLGKTYPNPLVGSVVVYKGKIIGEGWHQKAGEPHAEVHAINSVKDKSLLSKSTIYVSLEPCSHYGKTPPCCDLILHHNIPNIIIGTVDPFAKVAGKSIKKLLENGKNIMVGVLEKECNELNKRFFTFHNKKRPYIILKWAETVDHFIAPDKSLRNSDHDELNPVWITNPYSRQLVHKWRTEEQAILVGTQTVLDDNPKLNARDYFGKNPIRIIIDRNNKVNANFNIKDNSVNTFIFNENVNEINLERLFYKKIEFNSDFLLNLTNCLYENNIQSIIIEGGSKTIQSFIDNNLWDEARVFKSNQSFKKGVNAPKFAETIYKQTQLTEDYLQFYKNYD